MLAVMGNNKKKKGSGMAVKENVASFAAGTVTGAAAVASAVTVMDGAGTIAGGSIAVAVFSSVVVGAGALVTLTAVTAVAPTSHDRLRLKPLPGSAGALTSAAAIAFAAWYFGATSPEVPQSPVPAPPGTTLVESSYATKPGITLSDACNNGEKVVETIRTPHGFEVATVICPPPTTPGL